MLPALYDDERRAIARVAGMLVLGAACVLPMTVQGSAVASADETNAPHAAAIPHLPGPLTFPAYTLTRDPFETDRAIAAGAPRSAIAVVLPPNIGAGADGDDAVPASGNLAVRAIVLGERSRALVEEGGNVRVVGIGDAVDGLTVTEITASGIVLSDGSRVPLAEGR